MMCEGIRPQLKGVMKRRTGAIEREKRDVAKGKARIKCFGQAKHTREERALPPLRDTDGHGPRSTGPRFDERVGAKSSTSAKSANHVCETHEAGTTHIPDHAAFGRSSTAARLFSTQPSNRPTDVMLLEHSGAVMGVCAVVCRPLVSACPLCFSQLLLSRYRRCAL